MKTGELDKINALDEFFTRGVWLVDWPSGARLQGLSLKVQPTGYLAILRFVTAEGPQVAFYGKESLERLYRGLQSQEGRASVKLKTDRFALDNLAKNV